MNLTTTCLCLSLLWISNESDHWTSFRNGGSSLVESDRLPRQWSHDQNLTWKIELPGYGQSAPVVFQKHVYVTSVQGPNKEKCLVSCVDARTGTVVWTRDFAASTTARSDYRVSRAAPTPVVDSHGIYAFFEGGNLVCLTHDGAVRWACSLTQRYGPFDNHHGLGSSLAHDARNLFVLIDHHGPSYLLCVDKQTGQTRWKTDRRPRSSWTSPIVAEIDGHPQVIVSSSGSVEGYAPQTGELLWSYSEIRGNGIPSPIVVGDRVYACANPPRFANSDSGQSVSNVCLQVRKSEQGWSCQPLWKHRKLFGHYSSPIHQSGFLYFVNKIGVLVCLDADSGEVCYRKRLEDSCWATPIVCGEHVYLFCRGGTTLVIQVGPEYKEVASNRLWPQDDPPEKNVASPTSPANSQPADRASRLRRLDKDQDGRLSRDELPQRMQGLFESGDANQDGVIDSRELTDLAAKLQAQSDASRAEVESTVVYGVAATPHCLFVRTGRHLFCIEDLSTLPSSENGQD